jgi:hypothetical protein
MFARAMERLSSYAFLALAACGTQYAPANPSRDARYGWLGGKGPAPDAAHVCGDWRGTVGKRDAYALSHVSFAETEPRLSCYTRVAQEGRTMLVGHVPEGCPGPKPAEREAMRRLADSLETAGAGELFSCALSPGQRAAAARHDAAVLRRVASDADPRMYPYAAVIVPGYGEPAQADTSVATWKPGDACHDLTPGDVESLGAMMERTQRASDALSAGVAPLAIVSGGAVHSRMVEAFAMLFLLQCMPDRLAKNVLVEPCAQHTHTNLRNASRWLVAMGARAAYLVTDDGLQAQYFQDLSGFEFLGGSIDQRSLRDWGYVIGSWRQASVGSGTPTGFWFSPYRFWAEPLGPDGLGSMTCVAGGR